ncbi:hypothetical protein BJY04DRAFT_44669 [Aspergillus karnatakaensis]|uniref:uncharacterized protein n=1 Tax=Aspergillus karnatakaensis TaxID=1810916 RepID=UPI003CCD3344
MTYHRPLLPGRPQSGCVSVSEYTTKSSNGQLNKQNQTIREAPSISPAQQPREDTEYYPKCLKIPPNHQLGEEKTSHHEESKNLLLNFPTDPQIFFLTEKSQPLGSGLESGPQKITQKPSVSISKSNRETFLEDRCARGCSVPASPEGTSFRRSRKSIPAKDSRAVAGENLFLLGCQ